MLLSLRCYHETQRTFEEYFNATIAYYVKQQLEYVSIVHLVRAVVWKNSGLRQFPWRTYDWARQPVHDWVLFLGIFRVFMMTLTTKTKEITEASASVSLLLATALLVWDVNVALVNVEKWFCQIKFRLIGKRSWEWTKTRMSQLSFLKSR